MYLNINVEKVECARFESIPQYIRYPCNNHSGSIYGTLTCLKDSDPLMHSSLSQKNCESGKREDDRK